MSIDKMEQYKQNKKNRKPGNSKYDKEARDYKRDTICAIAVLLVLVLAPIGITVYQNHEVKAAQAANDEYMKQLQEALASASNANAASASEANESTEGAAANESAVGATANESAVGDEKTEATAANEEAEASTK